MALLHRSRIAFLTLLLAAYTSTLLMGCLPGEGAGSSNTAPDDDGCHTDCPGGLQCSDGVVEDVKGGPKPCSLGPGCDPVELGRCEDGCALDWISEDQQQEFASGDDGWKVMCEGLPEPADAGHDSSDGEQPDDTGGDTLNPYEECQNNEIPGCPVDYQCVQKQPTYCSVDWIGECQPIPSTCETAQDDQVCGCDDEVFAHECEARMQGYRALLEACPK